MHGGFLACWGRGDYGQLGAPANEVCAVDGHDIPCARTPLRGLTLTDGVVAAAAGDLFTCLSDRQGIECWGANQDAFFGSPASCPDTLRRAWPTLHGSVAAPRAACSPSPVRIAGAAEFIQDFQVGPRGMCFDQSGALQCIGAIETPRAPRFVGAMISPGQDASACAVLKRRGVLLG
jgi:hypothetical protein